MPWQLPAAIALLTPTGGSAFKQVALYLTAAELPAGTRAEAVPHQHWNEVFTQKQELLWIYRFTSQSSSKRKGFLSRQALQFFHSLFKTAPPKWLKSQSKWLFWRCLALKSGLQIWLLRVILYLGVRVAHCWAPPSQERPPDKFSNSCHQTAKKHASNGTSTEHCLQRIWKVLSFYWDAEENQPFEVLKLKSCSD